MPNKFGVPTDEQLSKINKLARRTMSADEVFVFPSKLAGDMIIPERNIQLTKELLDVFASDANKGVSFLLDHSWHVDGLFGMGGRPRAAIPYGRTFNSSFGAPTEEGETISLNSDTYMKRGVTIDGINTDDLIQSIESGTLFDTSIGFNFGKALCSVCGDDMNHSDECDHQLGKTYEVETNGIVKNVFCYAKACPPGGLWENSGVFDGAYPGAGMLSKSGDILENEHGIYQVITDLKGTDPMKPIIATYSPRAGLLTMVKKANHQKFNPVGGMVNKAKALVTDQESIFALGTMIGMSKEQVVKIANLVLKGGEKSNMNEELIEMLSKLGIAFEEAKTYSIDEVKVLVETWSKKNQEEIDSAKALATTQSSSESFMTKEQSTEKLGKELSSDEVLKLAKEGQEYHQQICDDAIAMGVRAMGNEFPVDTWKATFATMGTQSIKDITNTWDAQAKANIPAGRGTDPQAGLEGFKKTSNVPDEAYKVR